MTEPTTLVLIRHGESRATVDAVVGGHAGCTGLSDRGRAQAEALRDRLARTGEVGADVLVASVLPRAVETAEIIAPALGSPELVRDCDVCEIHPGEGDGLTWEEFTARYGDGAANDPFRPMAPGAESWAEFTVRVGRTLRRLAADHPGQRIVVVCHGGVIDGSFVAFGNLPLQRDFHLATENTSITEWRRRDDGWVLVRYNDAAHLAGERAVDYERSSSATR